MTLTWNKVIFSFTFYEPKNNFSAYCSEGLEIHKMLITDAKITRFESMGIDSVILLLVFSAHLDVSRGVNTRTEMDTNVIRK